MVSEASTFTSSINTRCKNFSYLKFEKFEMLSSDFSELRSQNFNADTKRL